MGLMFFFMGNFDFFFFISCVVGGGLIEVSVLEMCLGLLVFSMIGLFILMIFLVVEFC